MGQSSMLEIAMSDWYVVLPPIAMANWSWSSLFHRFIIKPVYIYKDYAGIVVLYNFFSLAEEMSLYDIVCKKNYKIILYTYAWIYKII
jgi:hypothetical protein